MGYASQSSPERLRGTAYAGREYEGVALRISWILPPSRNWAMASSASATGYQRGPNVPVSLSFSTYRQPARVVRATQNV
jgi:hypothetical protein